MSEATPPVTIRHADSADDVRLTVHDFGGDGRPVLAAHATGFNGLVWTPLALALTDARVIAPDFRTHGASTTPPGASLDWGLFGADVTATVDAFGWSDTVPRPVGIGHSMGGAALLLAEQRRPGTFAGLWLYEPIIFPPEVRTMFADTENPLAAGARRRRPVFDSRRAAVATYASKPPMDTFHPDALVGYVAGGLTDRDDGTVELSCRPEDEARVYTLASTCDAFEHLDTVTCPVVVVRGRLEPQTPAAITEPAAEALPRGRLHAHDELSHFGPMEDPIGLAAEINAFIADLDD